MGPKRAYTEGFKAGMRYSQSRITEAIEYDLRGVRLVIYLLRDMWERNNSAEETLAALEEYAESCVSAHLDWGWSAECGSAYNRLKHEQKKVATDG